MRQKLVIFDCDGTLVDSELIAAQVFPKYWATHGVVFSEEEFKEKFIGTGSTAPIVVETSARLPSYAGEEGDQLFDDALAQSLEAVPGMRQVLEGIPCQVCCASNSSLPYVKRALKKTGLAAFFGDRVYSAHEVERPKPFPDLFWQVSRQLGVDPADCVVVEDSVSGVKAAREAGMTAVAFSGASHFTPRLEAHLAGADPHIFCSSPKELQRTLSQWLQQP